MVRVGRNGFRTSSNGSHARSELHHYQNLQHTIYVQRSPDVQEVPQTFFGGGHAPILRHYRSDDVRMAAEYLRQDVKDRTNAAIADELRNGISGSEEKESSQIA